MRKLLLLLIVFISFSSFAQEVKPIDINTLTSKEKKGWVFNTDKFENITYIQKKWSETARIYPYIGIDNNNMYLRLVTEYRGDDWIFYEKIIFLIDGERYDFVPSKPDRKVVGNTAVAVSERADTYVDKNVFDLLTKIATAKTRVEYRLQGNFTANRKLSSKDLDFIKETLDFYERLKLDE